MTTGTRVVVAVLGLGLCACDRGPAAKEEHAMPRSGEAPPAAAKKPEAARTAEAAKATEAPEGASGAGAPGTADEVTQREMSVPSQSGAAGKVRVRLPVSWSQRAQSIVLEDESREAVAGVQFDVVCEKPCSDEDIARFGSIVDSTFETRARPNIGTGDAKLDAVRMDVVPVEEGKLPDARFRVARVTRPAGLEGPYRDELVAVCVRGRRGQQAIAAQGWAPIAREAELGPLIIEACKTFEILP